ncbi:MAG: polysaccharide deacetylase family protein [Pseudomonadota bacterium]
MRRRWKGKRIACITFDDGPDEPYTEQILDILKEKNIKATFFVLGKKTLLHEDIIKRITSEGHDIGNHLFSHKKITFLSTNEIKKEILDTNMILEGNSVKARIVRLPHGFRTIFGVRRVHKLGFTIIPWTKGIWDTQGDSPEKIFARFMKKFSNLEILLLHDGEDMNAKSRNRSATVKTLPKIIEEYKKRHYQFLTISELMS